MTIAVALLSASTLTDGPDSAATVTSCFSALTASRIDICTGAPAPTLTAFENDAKPGYVTETVYWPGVRPTTEKVPSACVCAVFVKPARATVTFVAGITAPESSINTPRTPPVAVCAGRLIAPSSAANRKKRIPRVLPMLPQFVAFRRAARCAPLPLKLIA